MSDQSSDEYEPPKLTAFGSIEGITANKLEFGQDADCRATVLSGSAPVCR